VAEVDSPRSGRRVIVNGLKNNWVCITSRWKASRRGPIFAGDGRGGLPHEADRHRHEPPPVKRLHISRASA
jgi:hypothetical protein